MTVLFFFQAEDGIRDHCVTGVQTCALPIWGGGRSRLLRRGVVVRGAAEDLEDHPQVALRCEVRDPGAAELTAEDHVVLTLCLRDGLVEVWGGDSNMVDALTFLSKETGIDAFLVECLDKLPHHLADRGDGDARGALDRLTVLAVVVRVTGVDLSEIPRTDPVVVHVPPYRGPEQRRISP